MPPVWYSAVHRIQPASQGSLGYSDPFRLEFPLASNFDLAAPPLRFVVARSAGKKSHNDRFLHQFRERLRDAVVLEIRRATILDDLSPPSDNSHNNGISFDDMENLLMILAMKELHDRGKTRKRRGLKVGSLCIPRNRGLGLSMLPKDYFVEVCTYPPHQFHRRSFLAQKTIP